MIIISNLFSVLALHGSVRHTMCVTRARPARAHAKGCYSRECHVNATSPRMTSVPWRHLPRNLFPRRRRKLQSKCVHKAMHVQTPSTYPAGSSPTPTAILLLWWEPDARDVHSMLEWSRRRHVHPEKLRWPWPWDASVLDADARPQLVPNDTLYCTAIMYRFQPPFVLFYPRPVPRFFLTFERRGRRQIIRVYNNQFGLGWHMAVWMTLVLKIIGCTCLRSDLTYILEKMFVRLTKLWCRQFFPRSYFTFKKNRWAYFKKLSWKILEMDSVVVTTD